MSCGSSIGIANQRDLWDTIKSPSVNIYRSTIGDIIGSVPSDAEAGSKKATIILDDGVGIDNVDLVVHATGYKPIVPIRFEPPSSRIRLGLSGVVDAISEQIEQTKRHNPSDIMHIALDARTKKHIQHWKDLDQQSEMKVRRTLEATGCTPMEETKASWAGGHEVLPYRLFRRMVAPELAAEGDRSFAVLGVVLTSTIAVVAEVQALWVTAFLTGGLDASSDDSLAHPFQTLCLNKLGRDVMYKTISEDVVQGSLTGTGLEVDAIHVSSHDSLPLMVFAPLSNQKKYNDMLMRDLGLNPHRLGGRLVKELTGVYEPSVYAGIVDEWRKRRCQMYVAL